MRPMKWQYAHRLGLIRLNEPGDEPGGGDDPDPQDGSEEHSDQPGDLDGAPWTKDDFDPERAWKLLQTVRSNLTKVKSERDEFKTKHDEVENAKLSDLQRTEKERDEARTETTSLQLENARLKALIKHGLDEDDLEFIGGSTAEEVAQRAAKYAERHKSDAKEVPPTNRPKQQLRGGGNPAESELSAAEVVAKATRR